MGANTLAYSGMELFMIVESFIVHPTDFGQAFNLALKYYNGMEGTEQAL
jgi:hypothetical protein